ncbi:MAG: SPOR domain-containing protein, partial [Marinilabiliaceae bacterium]
KMGSIKREAINLMEEELLEIPSSQGTTLSETSERPADTAKTNLTETSDSQPENKISDKEETPDTLVRSALDSSDQSQEPETEHQNAQNQEQKPVYKIQIGIFRNQPDQNALGSIPEVSSEEVADAQTKRYFSGKWDSYNEARDHIKEIRDKGFPGAFVVAFLDGEQIPLSEARELTNKK